MASRPRQRISGGSRFEEQIGYSRAVVVGDTVYVSGTTGYDYATMTLLAGVVEQCTQALRTIDQALAEAGCSLQDVVRVRYLVADAEEFDACWPVLREAFGVARPAATMMQVGLMDPGMRIELEVTAVR